MTVTAPDPTLLDIDEEVREALHEGRPVVALESSAIPHGLPYPANLDLALDIDAAVRAEGAVPARVALLDIAAVVLAHWRAGNATSPLITSASSSSTTTPCPRPRSGAWPLTTSRSTPPASSAPAPLTPSTSAAPPRPSPTLPTSSGAWTSWAGWARTASPSASDRAASSADPPSTPSSSRRPAPTPTASASTPAATAITAALQASGVRRPLLVMPPWFTEPTFRATEEYLGKLGIEETSLVQFQLGPEWDGIPRYNAFDEGAHWTIDPTDVHQQVAKAFQNAPRPDSVLVPCSGFPSLGAVASLEQELGVPVITSNQAVLWYGLQLAAPESAPDATTAGSLFGRRFT
ncbi:pseudouridine-5'-phosphate glycosidase [Streptomyces justiciae]|uniref:Pseudouridine-5'-phosphate glycosidase n=1 Tax=Streptomyces justiciae TaxID=2780140 RepID=A0ABU3LU39_9ACTN|nr:pseudouridine-5'-phosphate glycosidase [Streptomyces justiciae]MDT7842683.1 pseudouridine-5'-phosphate glycosidase [Streptomyces justiciae]